jgi:hypothetical protein
LEAVEEMVRWRSQRRLPVAGVSSGGPYSSRAGREVSRNPQFGATAHEEVGHQGTDKAAVAAHNPVNCGELRRVPALRHGH